MQTLYVDVDDTLITWLSDENFMTKYKPNEAVIAFVRNWVTIHKGKVIVWSLGGKDYAAKHAWQLLTPLGIEWAAMAKYPHIPQRGDLFIDDDPLQSYANASFHPDCLAQ